MEIVQDLEDLYIQEDQNAVFMCEVSLEDVNGEWYKDGHKIRPSSSIKIRTEGQRMNCFFFFDETERLIPNINTIINDNKGEQNQVQRHLILVLIL